MKVRNFLKYFQKSISAMNPNLAPFPQAYLWKFRYDISLVKNLEVSKATTYLTGIFQKLQYYL